MTFVQRVAAAAAVVAAGVAAQGETEAPGSAVSWSFGVDLPSQYFFRGIVQEDHGFILQPWVESAVELVPDLGVETLGGLDLTLGLWNSLHEGPTGSSGGRASWYESDFYGGLGTTIADSWSVGTTYTAYSSPNGSFATVQELAFTGAYDDAGHWGEEFGGLQPHAVLAFELDHSAMGPDNGVYLELGVEPSLSFGEDDRMELAIPVTLGTSLSDYYQTGTGSDGFFGFLDLGADFAMPIGFVPPRFGGWSFHAGLHFLLLGDETEALNAGDAFEVIATVGVSAGF